STNSLMTGSLNYFLPPLDTCSSQPYSHINADSVTCIHSRNWVEDWHIVNVENIRGSEDKYKLDNAGFQFGREASKHSSFLDDKEVEAEYYPECIDHIKRITGTSRVIIFDHSEFAIPDDNLQKPWPISFVHVDQTIASSIACVHHHLPLSDAPALLKRHFQIINLWCPISHPALDWPLALCNFCSIDVQMDLMAIALIYPDQEGEIFSVKFNEAHKWKYMQKMEPDEFILIKCFDSMQDGSVAVLTPHTVFEDPNSPEGVPLKESIEIRALVFYD
ncbi:hypothetical protein HD554DRAFT_2240870, partial [Boletus coccyginus]